MPSFKYTDPGIAMSGVLISPDEIDRYEVYTIVNPNITQSWVGAGASGGTAGQSKALTLSNKLLDYPRNLLYAIVGTSDMGGTVTVNGYDQFNNPVTETVSIGTASNGATTAGTQIFAEVTSGTMTVATAAVGNGTLNVGNVVTGTSLWFGLPTKIGAVTDVKSITRTVGTGAVSVNGGTVQSTTYVSTSQHAFSPQANLTGTTSYQVWFKPTYDNVVGNPIAAR